MKTFTLLFALATGFFTSCSSDTSRNSVGVDSEWKLIETRVSPGGHVDFTATDINEVVEFLEDSKIRKSSPWCGNSGENTVDYSEDGKIFTNCNGSDFLNFDIDGDVMIISNPRCIEPCQYRYKRIK